MAHHYHQPVSFPVNEMVHSVWEAARRTGGQKEIILPKGVVEIIFNFSEGAKITAQLASGACRLPRCFINGMNTQLIEVTLPEVQHFFGVRLYATVVRSLFGLPAGELGNHTLDLTVLDPSVDNLWHRLIEQPHFNGRLAVLTAWLHRRFVPLSSRDQLFNGFLNDHGAEVPTATVLANKLCYSTRQLTRKLQALTGMNTEDYLLYKRFLRSLQLIHYSPFSLTQISYHCGFADQSHFIRTFKLLSSLTPGDYKKQKTHLPGHFYLAAE